MKIGEKKGKSMIVIIWALETSGKTESIYVACSDIMSQKWPKYKSDIIWY